MTHIAGSNRGLATRFIWSFPGRSRNFRQQGFDEFAVAFPDPGRDLVALSDALEELAKADERKSRVVDLRRGDGESAGRVDGHGHARLKVCESVPGIGFPSFPLRVLPLSVPRFPGLPHFERCP